MTPRNRRARCAHLISQIPTCLKGLAFAAERWLPQSEHGRLLGQYFRKVVEACLAPGRNSVLCRSGAVRRLNAEDRANLEGGPDFALGVAALGAYLLQEFRANPWRDGSFMKDMLDVFDELPAPAPKRWRRPYRKWPGYGLRGKSGSRLTTNGFCRRRVA